MKVRRAIVFATDVLEPLPELARRAEAAGFARVWTTEYVGRDAIARALAIGLATDHIEVGTGIAYAFTRSPLAMAALAADVQRLIGGRFALGISPGTRGVRRWYGAEFDPPAPRMRAYAKELRAAWGQPWGPAVTPPIMSSVLNPIMARAVGQSCDGALLSPLAMGRVHRRDRLMPALRRGERDGGRTLQLAQWCVTSIDDDSQTARLRAAAQLAFYLSTPSYRTVAEGTDWADVPERVATAFDESGRTAAWTELAREVPDVVIDELAIAGDPGEVERRVQELEGELLDEGIEELVLQTVGAGLDDSVVLSNCQLIIDVLGPTIPARSS